MDSEPITWTNRRHVAALSSIFDIAKWSKYSTMFRIFKFLVN